MEHLPRHGPFLLVANHSAGMGLAELLSFISLYLEKVGPDRPLAGFVLPTDFRIWPLSAVVRSIGAIPSTYAAAEQTLEAQIPIMVFPGGDHESLRPIWHANRVDFGERLGFLRIARAARIPIVPLGIRGSHFTAPVLVRSRTLASLLIQPRLIGVKRWGISLLGLIGAVLLAAFAPLPWPLRVGLVWFWLGTPFVFLPWVPWTIRMRIGEPIEAPALFAPAGTAATDEELRQALRRIEGAVQALVRG
jgi:1-acyl-sn-glycerol-3-phosphate acyltransferase